MTVAVGKKVPNFKIEGTSDLEFDLKNYKGKNIVIYFYPKDSTPGCTQEGHDFTALLDEFDEANTEVFGISRDKMKSHENFKTKQCYPFELLSDPDETVCKLFDVIKEKNMYGKIHMGVERSTFLIGTDGKLVREWRKVKVKGHAEEVLAAVKEI